MTERAEHGTLNSAAKIKMVILAAMLAKDSLELLAMDDAGLCRLQFIQIVKSMKALDEHLHIPAKRKRDE